MSYLYGPGRRGEHADPHLVASWDGFAPDPGRDPNATLKELADLLDLPVRRAGDKAPSKHVWHMSVRLAPEDRALTETEWGEVARRLMRATGIDPGPDSEEPFCRWVAVRHDDNHIHFAATLARSDGEAYHPFHEGKAAQKEARRIERDLGLRRLDKRDRTAARPPSKAEQFKAERTGRLPRKRLQTLVRTAAAYAADPDDFLTLLGHVGVLARPNRDTNGTIRGCAFALADDRNAAGEPVWFGGRTLAPDLSWPNLHAQLTSVGTAEPLAGDDSTGSTGTSSSTDQRWPDLAATDPWDCASAHLDRIAALLNDPTRAENHKADQDARGTRASRATATCDAALPDEVAAAHRAAVGQLLSVLPGALHGHPMPLQTRQDLRDAADAFAHAARTTGRTAHAHSHAARQTFRALTDTLLTNRTNGAEVVGDLIATALLAVIAVTRWHQANKHEAQARAAAQAAAHLRAAYRVTAPKPLQQLTAEHTPDPRLATLYAQVTHRILATRTDQATTSAILSDPAMAALTAAIHRGTNNNHNPLVLVDQAVTSRELATADNPAEVLTWRIHRLARTTPATARRGNNPDGRRTGKPTTTTRTGTRRPTPPPTANPNTRRTR
ncbi:relaxase/mobilization nuclease domain-containing protein [Yinghuangia aomiensis]|uniref:relaxase/mobilization nuclease domain-containing protein n=1 Tax=Yinghuangia aomiensis TaxID=676205 RepID=UPI0031E6AC98